jgi:hypothetical protein
MTFKEFVDKYAGLTLGIIIALIIIALKLVYAVQCIVLVIAFAWFGKYLQKNKTSVKEKLKTFIDKL